ncbi:EAL domain-containing protein [Lacisediminihabitans sp. H27-G8]|uniref:EAL domain-containing protein n=1 Tax=Lacisediminihabitans sp. H27-G8 TaxID=3111909 RepID=UPI0038FC4A01
MSIQPSAVPLGESELSEAIARGEIVAHFQPQVDLRTGDIVAVETLSRWEHPHRGVIGPGEFIPLAERTGLIHRMGAHMIEQGCRVAAGWIGRGRPVEVSINVSATQLSTPLFFADVISSLERTCLLPGLLTLEITESQAITDIRPVRDHLGQLRDRGVGISIDDFGTGYSSIERLLRLGATELKLDRTLIQARSDSTLALVAAVVSLVHERGIRVVAEGVETADHLEQTRRLGCDRAQGFLFAPPTTSTRLEQVFSANRPADWIASESL